ncbi:MAG TPA: OmpH family outer membrane protein [Planctomycetota bacterium]|nr:OmpH family outer membrane protein [Planctomycetota bacterium]
MRNWRQPAVGLVAAFAVAAFALAGGARAQDGAPAKALKIAVLNMSDCIEAARNDHAKDLETRFNQINRETQEEMAKIRKKADELKAQVKGLEESGPGSDLYMKKAAEWNLEEARYKIATEMRQLQLRVSSESFRTQLYSDARKMTTLLAQEQKIDLVLRTDEGAFEAETTEFARTKNALRSVLYNEPSMDITAAVLARLNEDYKKKKK